VLARYDALVAARDALPADDVAPDELARALTRIRRNVERAIARDRGPAADARLERRIREQGLIRVEARRLADELRTIMPVNAETTQRTSQNPPLV
jgi:hypothetical protein